MAKPRILQVLLGLYRNKQLLRYEQNKLDKVNERFHNRNDKGPLSNLDKQQLINDQASKHDKTIRQVADEIYQIPNSEFRQLLREFGIKPGTDWQTAMDRIRRAEHRNMNLKQDLILGRDMVNRRLNRRDQDKYSWGDEEEIFAPGFNSQDEFGRIPASFKPNEFWQPKNIAGHKDLKQGKRKNNPARDSSYDEAIVRASARSRVAGSVEYRIMQNKKNWDYINRKMDEARFPGKEGARRFRELIDEVPHGGMEMPDALRGALDPIPRLGGGMVLGGGQGSAAVRKLLRELGSAVRDVPRLEYKPHAKLWRTLLKAMGDFKAPPGMKGGPPR